MREAKRSRSIRKRKERLGNRMALVGIIFVVISLAVVVNFRGSSLREKDLSYQRREQSLEEQLEKAEEEKKDGKDPETKEEQQIQHLNNISNASLDYKQVGQIHKAHDQKKREASVMTMEVKLDDSRGGASKGKRERLGEVLSEADQLYKKAMKGYANLNKSLDEEEEENIEEQKELKSEDGQGNGTASGPAGGEQDTASGLAGEEQGIVSGSAEGAQEAASRLAGRDKEEDE